MQALVSLATCLPVASLVSSTDLGGTNTLWNWSVHQIGDSGANSVVGGSDPEVMSFAAGGVPTKGRCISCSVFLFDLEDVESFFG